MFEGADTAFFTTSCSAGGRGSSWKCLSTCNGNNTKPKRHQSYHVIHHGQVDNRHHMAWSLCLSLKIAVWPVFGLLETFSGPLEASENSLVLYFCVFSNFSFTSQCETKEHGNLKHVLQSWHSKEIRRSLQCLFCTLPLQALAPLSAGHHSPIGGGLKAASQCGQIAFENEIPGESATRATLWTKSMAIWCWTSTKNLKMITFCLH